MTNTRDEVLKDRVYEGDCASCGESVYRPDELTTCDDCKEKHCIDCVDDHGCQGVQD